MSIISDLIDKKITIQTAAEQAIKNESILSELLDGILSKKEEIRFHSHETLLIISEKYPEVLYPKWDYLSDLLTSDNHFHRYIAINLIANLVKVDVENKFERDFDNYFENIAGERTMVAGQAALNAGNHGR